MALSSKQLAEMLGVSPAAVSIALNGKKGISDRKRELILTAARTYGIKTTTQISAPKSNYINLVIFKKHGLVYGDTPFFGELIEGLSYNATSAGYNMQITYFYADQNTQEQMQVLTESDCTGVILLATEMKEEDILLFQNFNKQLVILDSYFPFSRHDCVVINNAQGAYMAARHLILSGHSQLGYVRSKARINNFEERVSGFLKALNEIGKIDQNPVVYIDVASTQDGAYNDMNDYLNAGKPIPKALFIENDLIAVSCMRALKEHSFNIPDDVSIIGFDDIPMSYVISPKLTTIQVPKNQLGQQAVKMLIDRISGKAGEAPVCSLLGTKLINRDTVK